MQQTALFEEHLAAGAKIVPFAGFEMPLHYGSQMVEHHAVRTSAGMFDVSHMAVTDFDGKDARAFLRRCLANDVAKLKTPGRALYTTMLREDGGIIDDLICYWRGDDRFRVVFNAARREADLAWVRKLAEQHDVRIGYRDDLAMIAVQGPTARELVGSAIESLPTEVTTLSRFSFCEDDVLFVARTGYTGEDGYEMIVPVEIAGQVWRSLKAAGAQPAGLGARDTLRLEAGLLLYGQDMDESTSPLESQLGWTVAFEPVERVFVGREALEHQRQSGNLRKLIGVELAAKGVLRAGQRVRTDEGDGKITSGSYSPSLERSIGLARVPGEASNLHVEIRGRELPLVPRRLPFVKAGGTPSESLSREIQ